MLLSGQKFRCVLALEYVVDFHVIIDRMLLGKGESKKSTDCQSESNSNSTPSPSLPTSLDSRPVSVDNLDEVNQQILEELVDKMTDHQITASVLAQLTKQYTNFIDWLEGRSGTSRYSRQLYNADFAGWQQFITQYPYQFQLKEFQSQAIDLILNNKEVALPWARGASKSWLLTQLAIFLSFSGYEVVWRSAGEDQLSQPMKYFNEHPAVAKVTADRVKLINGSIISIGPLTQKRARSRRADVLILDEEREMDYDSSLAARGMISNSAKAKIIHASTPAFGTPFEYICLGANKLDDNCIFYVPWDKTEGLVKEAIVLEEIQRMPIWYCDLEYRAKWSVAGGAAFPNAKVWDSAITLPGDVKMVAGIDWNGLDVGCVVVIAAYTKDKIFVLNERSFPHNMPKEAVDWAYSQAKTVEVEDGGLINQLFTAQLDTNCLKQSWTNQMKKERLGLLLRRDIYVDSKLAPKTWDNVRSAQFKPNGEIDKSKDGMHFLEALMHSIHVKSTYIGAIH